MAAGSFLPILRSRFFWRLYAAYVVLILATALVIGLLVVRRVERGMIADVRQGLRSEAVLLADVARPCLEGGASTDLRGRFAHLGAETRTRLTLIRADGLVLADTDEDPSTMDDHGDRPEVLAAREQGFGASERFSRTLGVDLYYAAVRVPPLEEGEVLGYARTAVPLSAVAARTSRLVGRVVLGASMAALAGLALAYVFASRVTAQVTSITTSAESIARGSYSHVPESGTDEIGSLARAFNLMSDQLRERMEIITADRNKVLAILGGMVEGVIAVDGDERVVHMNDVAGRLLGVAPADGVGKRIWEVTRGEEIPGILDRTRIKEEVTGEVQLTSEAGGEGRIIELTASPLRDAAGERAGGVIVLHDVTELRRLEQVRRDFVANVSHELKTPLTAIRGLVETVLDDREMDPATARHFVERVRVQTDRLTALVTDLLTLARIESDHEPLEGRPLDLREPVRECAARFVPLCQRKGLRLEIDLADDPVILRADEENLRQIVGNLLDNAVKYTPEGGRVQVRVVRGADEARIEVADTGIGIAPQEQDRVFERFYRVDKARSRELGGTGLGLSIVKHLTLALDGRISLLSSPGKGSTFVLHVPTERPASAAAVL